jgi:outer membrane cobalamin receptor
VAAFHALDPAAHSTVPAAAQDWFGGFTGVLHPAFMTWRTLAAELLCAAAWLATGQAFAQISAPSPMPVDIRGRVVDFQTGEPIARALVAIRSQGIESTTDAEGRFELRGVAPGEIEVYASTVGYGLIKQKITIPVGANFEVELLLGQDALKHSERIEVRAGPFAPVDPAASSEQNLQSVELKNLSSVLAADPMRAVHSLPGVTASDDTYAQFAVRGAGFDKIGVYLDGAQTPVLFHTILGVDDSASVTVLSSDMLESVALLSGPYPAAYGDRTGGVLNLQTRDGSRERLSNRVNLNLLGVAMTSEGPLDRSHKASWLVSARKSYLGYAMKRIGTDGFAIGVYDVQGKLSYQLTESHRLALTAIHGETTFERNKNQTLFVDQLAKGLNRTDNVVLNWIWTPGAHTVSQMGVNFGQLHARNQDQYAGSLGRWDYGQWGWHEDFSRQFGSLNRLDAGGSARRLRQDNVREVLWDFTANSYATAVHPIGAFRKHTWQSAAYAQDTLTFWGKRATLTAGVRFDRLTATHQDIWTPHASLSLAVLPRTRLTAAYGQYSQFPSLWQLYGENGVASLNAERSVYYQAGVDRMLSSTLRVRVEAYNRQEREVIYSPLTEFRMVNGVPTAPVLGPVLGNNLWGRSRGLEITLQQRSANRLSGWISYARGAARFYQPGTSLTFWSDFDQRNTFAMYASYRLSKTINLSGNTRYGSGYPVAGFLAQPGSYVQPSTDERRVFALSNQPNLMRAPDYWRADVRINKALYRRRTKTTLFFEIDNVTDHKNYRFCATEPSTYRRGWISIDRPTTFPLLPTLGATIEF